MSEAGKFDAEQRERLRIFTAQVLERANQAEAAQANKTGVAVGSNVNSADLQEMIDNLRAEIAQVRAELKQYRNTDT